MGPKGSKGESGTPGSASKVRYSTFYIFQIHFLSGLNLMDSSGAELIERIEAQSGHFTAKQVKKKNPKKANICEQMQNIL